MRKNSAFLILVSVLALSFSALAQEPPPTKPLDVAGIWILTMQTPQGEMAMEASFTQEKEVIKVSMMSPMGTEMKGEGTIKDKDLQWTMTVSTPGGEFALLFKGKVDRDSMAGEVQMGDFGTSPWSAKKKK